MCIYVHIIYVHIIFVYINTHTHIYNLNTYVQEEKSVH